MQDAQKGQISHPPTQARPDAPCPEQGRNSAADPRVTVHGLWERGENAAGGLFQHPLRARGGGIGHSR